MAFPPKSKPPSWPAWPKIKHSNLAEKPGYYLTYFPGQANQFGSYLSAAMLPEFGSRSRAPLSYANQLSIRSKEVSSASAPTTSIS